MEGEEDRKGSEDAEEDGWKKKRDALEDVYRDLTRRKITFGQCGVGYWVRR